MTKRSLLKGAQWSSQELRDLIVMRYRRQELALTLLARMDESPTFQALDEDHLLRSVIAKVRELLAPPMLSILTPEYKQAQREKNLRVSKMIDNLAIMPSPTTPTQEPSAQNAGSSPSSSG